jgi:hypothetical protein
MKLENDKAALGNLIKLGRGKVFNIKKEVQETINQLIKGNNILEGLVKNPERISELGN